MRIEISGTWISQDAEVSMSENGGFGRRIATLRELVEFWKAGHSTTAEVRRDNLPTETPAPSVYEAILNNLNPLTAAIQSSNLNASPLRAGDVHLDVPAGSEITIRIPKESS